MIARFIFGAKIDECFERGPLFRKIRAPSAPRGPKRAPRSAKSRQESPGSDFGAILEPFWVDFGPPRGAKTLIFAATVVKNQGFRVFAKAPEKETQKAPKGGPREAKMAPRSAPGGPRSGPRGAKTAPGAARSAPGAPQEPPKRRKKGAKWHPVFGSARGGGPGSHFGAIFE